MTENRYHNLLAIETSTLSLKLALSFGEDRLVKSEEVVDRSHGQLLLKKINELFGSASLQKQDLEGIVVSVGPGSFTGLRIGLAAAKGMAVALKIPIASVNLFEIAAYRLHEVREPVHVYVALKRDEYVTALIQEGAVVGGTMRTIFLAAMQSSEPDGFAAGVGFDIRDALPSANAPDNRYQIRFDATDVLAVGRAKLQSDHHADLALLEPLYLQKSQAEIRFDQRHQKA
ncbi:MAG TPA: tRNA (adenosine(37)-N6)-threonylcarbamoyltransferase complex dimerization subunit type 1 TsaB [Candidatus Acidoferrum sp.]|nr:tRNA (adenosine(37)-N6)-threonylcarbamoyltransferase complex dimerization subunit type 1 TsaB [Candidatus Acidoferrum sp.]